MDSIFPVFSQFTGWIVLAVYAVFVMALTLHFVKGYAKTKTSFLVANRELGGIAGAMSIGAAWTWAPAMYISAQMAYVNGIAGLFWFCLGNFFTLILFGFFAKRLRDREPEGFTIAGYVKDKFSTRVQNIFLVELWVLAICAFAINVLAGSKTIETLTGIDYHIASVVLAALAAAYALRGGLKASVVTEIFKISVLLLGFSLLVPWAWGEAGGVSTLVAGLGGKTGLGDTIFGNEFAMGVFMSVGFAMSIGHMGALWGDNGFYQRAFAIHPDRIIPSFVGGAFVFIFIPLMAGSLGFVAAGQGMEIAKADVSMTALITMASNLPNWTLIPFVFMLFAGLVSVLDSQLSSASSLAGHDLRSKFKSERSAVLWARGGMVALLILALILANWPGMQIFTIFIIFGVMRATIWWPMMLHLWKPEIITERGMFWGILIAYLTGFPVFVYGKLFEGGSAMTFGGTMFAVFGSGALAYLISRYDLKKSAALPSKPSHQPAS